MDNSFIIKGDLAFSVSKTEIQTIKNGYLVCENGISKGVYKAKEEIPEKYTNFPIKDYTNKLVIPGMVDMHIHAPQFSFRGTGMDLELIPWLNTYTFKEESKFEDLEYAKKAYGLFSKQLQKSATTRAVIFATRHREATTLLMDLMEKTGVVSYVGKINMDRESIPELMDKGFLDSAYTTFGWINDTVKKYKNTYPILTPRFIPSCSDELMNELKEISKTYNIPVQSHLSENLGEIEWVKALCPWSKFYGDAYDHYDLFGGDTKTVMAHCVYSPDEEVELMKKKGVYVAHCPSSNMNLSSGIAPIRRYLDEGLNVGLGSDVAGGETESMFRTIVQAIQVSKMYWRLKDESQKPLTFDEAFYIATLGGGSFFGNVGSFLDGNELDAVVIDDLTACPAPYEMDIRQRLERAVYTATDINAIEAKFARGNKIDLGGNK